MSEYLKITRNGQILEIVLDRPKANTLDGPLSREMGKVFAEFRDDPELRVAILTGAGEKFFSAGWDLNAVAEGEEYLGDYGEGGFGGFPEMTNLLKPVICAVNGMAVGGGFEMLLRADFIVAAEHAQFMLPESPHRHRARRRHLHAAQAAAASEGVRDPHDRTAPECAGAGGTWDRSTRSCRLIELMDRARALAEDLCRAAPLSLAAIKEAVHLTEKLSFEESYASLRSESWPAFMKMLESSDAREGATAFVEKRDPEWKGE